MVDSCMKDMKLQYCSVSGKDIICWIALELICGQNLQGKAKYCGIGGNALSWLVIFKISWGSIPPYHMIDVRQNCYVRLVLIFFVAKFVVLCSRVERVVSCTLNCQYSFS